MSIFEAIILGIIQGLTEFLPVSSSGHLELASHFLGIDEPNNMQFSIALHGATVLSTVVVFWHELWKLIKGFFQFKMNEETKYIINIFISMIPIGIVGVLFKSQIESLFTSNVLLVGSMLLVTAALLVFAQRAKPREKEVTPKSAFIIGLTQALAIVPGLSRSGTTISTGLMLGVKREEVSKFSFLMVLIPILGANFLDLIGGGASAVSVATGPLLVGSITAFITGAFACRLMIRLINRGKLIWFAVYCVAMGLFSIGSVLF